MWFRFAKDVKIVHFLGSVKPWHHSYAHGRLHYRGESQHLESHVQHWWNVFFEDVQPRLYPEHVS